MVVALLSALAIVAFNSVAPQPDPAFKNLLISDSLGNFFAIVTVTVALFVAVASLEALRKSDNAPVYYGLLSFTALGMLLLSFTQDLLMLFVSWELMSLPTYVLAGFDKKRVQSNEASVKYAILGAMSSAILLYAISLTYGLTGTTQIIPAVRAIAAQPLSLATSIAILLFVAGFGFKMSIVPFHMWIPDAYEGAPTTVSTLLAAATKKAGFVAAIRVLLAATTVYVITQNPIFTMANILAVLALLTMTLGNAAALTQRSMTRLLAYSSIAQAGYILVGFVAYAYGQQTNAFSQQTNAYFTEATIGMTGALFHILNHAIMKGAAFLVAALVLLELKRGDVEAYSGLGRRMPVAAFTMTVAFLALAGVPPLNGFWSKLLLFLSVINGPFAWLAVAGIVNSAFSLGYYAWVIKRIYIDESESNEKVKEPIPFIVVFGVSVGLMIGLGLFPQQVINFASSAVPNIFPR
ncbi:MAG: NADH-quinone oxidoreductase subunit N [Thaumarchaeota archaeon]|nr:MAG: NADH-quinone oxidoreductase subunit N [Nitrososphaerota archaeon]